MNKLSLEFRKFLPQSVLKHEKSRNA